MLTASAHTGLGIDKLQQQLDEYQAVMLHSGELAQVCWLGRGVQGLSRMHACLLGERAAEHAGSKIIVPAPAAGALPGQACR